MNIFIGKSFKFISNGKVFQAEIIDIKEKTIIVLLDGKNRITLDKQKFINKFSDYEVEKNLKEKSICENCMEYKKGNCCGQSEICDDFRYSPEISQEERNNWPKNGSVSRSRSDKAFIREYDEMYNKYHQVFH